MANCYFQRLLIISTVLAAALVSGGDIIINSCIEPVGKASIEAAAAGGGELGLGRRKLATSEYISYSALQGNNVPCSRRGASYYNCQQGAEANPYTRSCTAVTLCSRS